MSFITITKMICFLTFGIFMYHFFYEISYYKFSYLTCILLVSHFLLLEVFMRYKEPIVLVYLIIVLECIKWIYSRKKYKETLTPFALQDGLDNMNDGICFVGDNRIILMNHMINTFSLKLNGYKCNDIHDILKHINHHYLEVNNHIYRYSYTHINASIDEHLFLDVTDVYMMNKNLEEENERLKEMNEKISLYHTHLDDIVREKEILNAKILVHDNVGRCLLYVRRYLSGAISKEEPLSLLKNTISLLSGDVSSYNESDPMSSLMKAADDVGVSITTQGEIPISMKPLVVDVLHEALTNLLRHTDGHKIMIETYTTDHLIIDISNDGTPPDLPIEEKGGLRNMRHKIESEGCRMTILYQPVFKLRIERDF